MVRMASEDNALGFPIKRKKEKDTPKLSLAKEEPKLKLDNKPVLGLGSKPFPKDKPKSKVSKQPALLKGRMAKVEKKAQDLVKETVKAEGLSTKKGFFDSDGIQKAAIGLVPILLGGLLGGSEGALAGVQAGAKGIEILDKSTIDAAAVGQKQENVEIAQGLAQDKEKRAVGTEESMSGLRSAQADLARAKAASLSPEAQAKKLAAKNTKNQNELIIPDVGIALTKDDAKQGKNTRKAAITSLSTISKLEDLRKEFGFEVANRDAVARGKSLATDLKLEIKNLAQLGVLSKTDEELLDRMIGNDPLGVGTEEGFMSQFSALREQIEDKEDIFFQTRGLPLPTIKGESRSALQREKRRRSRAKGL